MSHIRIIGLVTIAVLLIIDVSIFIFPAAIPNPTIGGLIALALFVVAARFVFDYFRLKLEKGDDSKEVEDNIADRIVSARPAARRGGPPPMPADKQREIVEGWLQAQQKGETQEEYCHRVGIGPSTLRSWMRKMKVDSG